MNAKMQKKVEWYKTLSTVKKIQFVTAALFSLASIAALSVFAWFSFQNKVETMSYVNDPPTLSLASGHNDSVQCFELKNIDVKRETDGEYYQDYVFSIETGKAAEYDIQLAHTTNIPFVYELYRAKEDENGIVEYNVQEGDDAGKIIRYSILSGTFNDEAITISQDIQLENINPQDVNAQREIGSESVLKSTYGRENYTDGDTYNQFVEPLYSVARHIQTNDKTIDASDSRDYFILRVSWVVNNNAQGNEYWNYAFNDKETDILYITVKESRDSST